MEFKIRKASDWKYEETVTLATLEEMEKFYNAHGHNNLVVNFKNKVIIIYDSWLE